MTIKKLTKKIETLEKQLQELRKIVGNQAGQPANQNNIWKQAVGMLQGKKNIFAVRLQRQVRSEWNSRAKNQTRALENKRTA